MFLRYTYMANTGGKKLATFNIEGEVWQAFQTKAREDGYSAAALLKEWIGAYLGGTGSIPMALGSRHLDTSAEKTEAYLDDSQLQRILEALAPRVINELVPQVAAVVESRLPDSIDMYLDKNLGSRLGNLEGDRLGESERLGEIESLRQELEQARAEIEKLRSQNAELESEAARESAKAGETELKLQDAIGEVASLKAEVEELRSQLSSQPAGGDPEELEQVRRENRQLRAAMFGERTYDPLEPDFEAIAARALASLKLGSAAPGYKAAKKALARFVEALKAELKWIRPVDSVDSGDIWEDVQEMAGRAPTELTTELLNMIISAIAFRAGDESGVMTEEKRKARDAAWRRTWKPENIPNKYPFNAGLFD